MALDPRIALMGRAPVLPDIVERRGQRARNRILGQQAIDLEREAAQQEAAAQIFAERGVIDDQTAAALMAAGAFKPGIEAYRAVGGRAVDNSQVGANQALGTYRGAQTEGARQKTANEALLFPSVRAEAEDKARISGGLADRLAPTNTQAAALADVQARTEQTREKTSEQQFMAAWLSANRDKYQPGVMGDFGAMQDARKAWAVANRVPTPGTDVPYSPDVLAQRIQMRGAGAPRTSVTVQAEQRTFNNEQDLRKEFAALPVVKAYNEVKRQSAQARNAYNEFKKKGGSANSVDQVIVTSLNKVLDPDSVVRESEYARTADGQSLLNRLSGYLGKLTSGSGGLSADERAAVVATIEQLNATMEQQYAPVAGQFRGLALQYKLNPDRVTREFTPVENEFNAKGGKGKIDAATAKMFLDQAGGDKDKARALAKAAGWSF